MSSISKVMIPFLNDQIEIIEHDPAEFPP